MHLSDIWVTVGHWVWLAGVPIAAGLGFFFGLGKKAAEATAEAAGKVFGADAANWVKQTIVPRVSRYRDRYLDHLYFGVRDFDVKGFADDGPWALELRDVFVDLTLDPKSARELISNPLIRMSPERLRGRHSIWEYLNEPEQRLAVIGPPGSGKTTLLKHVSLAACRRRGLHVRSKAAKKLPVLIFLRSHARPIAEVAAYDLASAARSELGALGDKAPKGWFERHLEKGRCLVLLDGLDEVADMVLRRQVVVWVEQQMRLFGKNRFIVTSRPHGYRSNPIQGVNLLEVCSFTPEQVHRFVHSWYLANEIKRHRKDDPGVRREAREGADGLLGKLRQSRDLSDLAVNPLLLTMIATVHRYRGSLPGSRVELYGDICKVVLGRRRQARGLDFELSSDQKQSILEPLAHHMMMTGLREIPVEDAARTIKYPLSEVLAKADEHTFLREIENSSGLFVERESGEWSFAHLTFQEYLASAYVLHQGLGDELAKRVQEKWWRETIRLFVGQADATQIINACLGSQSSSVEDIAFGIECLDEAKKIDPVKRTFFEQKLTLAAETERIDERRPICEALLSLCLKRMVAIDGDRQISSFIRNAEYQLFVDERSATDYMPPDLWCASKFPRGKGTDAVTIMRASEASQFCRWLGERFPDGHSYRLPTRAESETPYGALAGDNDIGYWIHDQNLGYSLPRQTVDLLRQYVVNADLDAELDGQAAAALALDCELLQNLARMGDLGYAKALADQLRQALGSFEAIGLPPPVRASELVDDLSSALCQGKDLKDLRRLGNELSNVLDLQGEEDAGQNNLVIRVSALAVNLAFSLDVASQVESTNRELLNLDFDSLCKISVEDIRKLAVDLILDKTDHNGILISARSLKPDLDRALRLIGLRGCADALRLYRAHDSSAEWMDVARFLCKYVRISSAIIASLISVAQERRSVTAAFINPGPSRQLEEQRQSYLRLYAATTLFSASMSAGLRNFCGIRVIRERSAAADRRQQSSPN